MMIEVERKFLLTSHILEKVKQESLEKYPPKVVLLDVYYDTVTNALMSHDMWLRKRNNIWQLKSRVDGSAKHCETTQYLESENKDEILSIITPLLSEGRNTLGLSELVDCGTLLVIMELTSSRQSFHIGHLTVDVDQTDFGFDVGEIEVLVEKQSDIPAAVEDIELLARKLGVSTWTHEGKVDNYLARNNVPLLGQLRKVGVLKTPSDTLNSVLSTS